jgi:hypothetical protein
MLSIDMLLLVPLVGRLLIQRIPLLLIQAFPTTRVSRIIGTLISECIEIMCIFGWFSLIKSRYAEFPQIRLYLRQRIISTNGTVCNLNRSI